MMESTEVNEAIEKVEVEEEEDTTIIMILINKTNLKKTRKKGMISLINDTTHLLKFQRISTLKSFLETFRNFTTM